MFDASLLSWLRLCNDARPVSLDDFVQIISDVVKVLYRTQVVLPSLFYTAPGEEQAGRTAGRERLKSDDGSPLQIMLVRLKRKDTS